MVRHLPPRPQAGLWSLSYRISQYPVWFSHLGIIFWVLNACLSKPKVQCPCRHKSTDLCLPPSPSADTAGTCILRGLAPQPAQSPSQSPLVLTGSWSQCCQFLSKWLWGCHSFLTWSLQSKCWQQEHFCEVNWRFRDTKLHLIHLRHPFSFSTS